MEDITKKYIDLFVFFGNKSIFCRYYELSSEILSSVRKMEDSIQRLRRVRESSKTMSQSMPATDVLTDDNKIRMQIQNDVNEFTNKVIEFLLLFLFLFLFFLSL